MKNLIGMKWKDLTNEEQEEMLNNVAACINGETGNNVEYGECIIDFNCDVSIPGYLAIDEDEYIIQIDENAIFYNPYA